MKTVNIVKAGKRSDNSFYALIEKDEQGFILNGFIKTTRLLEVGLVEIPSVVEAAIQYKA